MKKCFNMVLFFFLLLLPSIVKAYGIENFYLDATVEVNGDLVVEEYFNLTGDYNGFERIINYANESAYPFDPTLAWYGGSNLHNGSGIILQRIMAVDVNNNFNFSNLNGDIFTQTISASKGDYGVYTKSQNSYGESYRIYLPSTKGKAFYLKYTLKNMAILHEDVAEIGWNVVGNQLSEDIENLRVLVHFPNNQNEFRVWAHGPLHGNVKKVSQDTLEATIQHLSSYQAIDVRATFDKNVIPLSTKKSNVNALEKILAYEENQANQANYERHQYELKNQQRALQELEYCEEYPSRSCYETAKGYVNRVTDKEVFSVYNERLTKLKQVVTEKEEQQAKESVSLAQSYVEYYWYREAKEDVEILENAALKNELTKKLDVVKDKLIIKEQKHNNMNKIISIFLLCSILGILIYVYLKYDKEYQPEFKETYLREFPDDLTPTSVSYLFKHKITNEAVSAEILNMIYKKIIFYEKIGKKDYILRKNPAYQEPLSLKEERLLKLLFNDNDKITLSKIKKRAKRNSYSFGTAWDNFKTQAISEAQSKKLYENDKGTKKSVKTNENNLFGFIVVFMIFIGLVSPLLYIIFIPCILFYLLIRKMRKTKWNGKLVSKYLLIFILIFAVILVFVNLILNHFVHHSIFYNIVVIILSSLGMTYISRARKRTREGVESFAKWNALKHFLNDFSTFNEKELPQVELWEKYLVYALVLGCAKKLSKVMKIKLEEMNTSLDFVSDIYVMSSINHELRRVMTRSIRTAQRRSRISSFASSSSSSSGSWSSGSGGGGGFSSGGGSFGGGGGGGRF